MNVFGWGQAVRGWWRGLGGEGRARALARVALVALAVALLLFLRGADKPWERGAETRPDPSVKHYVVSGLWWAAAANVLGCAFLLATVRLWVRRLPAGAGGAGRSGVAPGDVGGRRMFVALVSGAMVLGAISAGPRLGLSLWGDEEHTMRTYVLGSYQWGEGGELGFRRLDWQRSLWGYVNPNNHVLNTVLSRLSLEFWARHWGVEGGLPFAEWALRLPAFLAAIGGIGAIAWMLRGMGMPRAGVAAAFLCVLHPWYLRYAAESRGYAFLFLLLPLVTLFLVAGVGRGGARWWMAFAVAEFLLMWAYPGSLHFLALTNLAGLTAIWWVHGRGGVALALTGRWLAASAVAGMAFLQVYAPCVPQLIAYTRGARAQAGEMTAGWLADLLGHIFFGMAWVWPDPTNRLAQSLDRVLGAHPGAWVVVGAVPLLALVGFARMQGRGRLVALLGWAFLLVGPLMVMQAAAIRNYLYYAHMIFTLPLAIALIAVGLDGVTRVALGRRGVGASALGCALLLLGYGALTMPQRRVLRRHPIEAQRESVLATRAALGPGAAATERVITVGLRRGGGHLMTVPSYDVAARYVADAGDLRGWMTRADETGARLYLNLAMLELARVGYADVMALVDDRRRFRLEAEFPGLEPNTTRYVYRYLGGVAAGAINPGR